MAYLRTVKTASGATAVQIVHGSRRGARTIEHVGSAHDELELEALKAAARQRLAGGQAELDLGLDLGLERSASATTGSSVGPAVGSTGRPLEIASSRMGRLSHVLARLGVVRRKVISRTDAVALSGSMRKYRTCSGRTRVNAPAEWLETTACVASLSHNP